MIDSESKPASEETPGAGLGPEAPDWRSYGFLLWFQMQNAFNDKVAQFLLIPLAAFLVAAAGGEGDGGMALKLSAFIVLPYVLFAPLVGWLADRLSKVQVIRWMALVQLGVLGCIYLSIRFHQLNWAVVGFCMLAVQSTILSPAKKGVIKELVGSEKLGVGSGLVEMGTILAILAGQIATSFWFDARVAAYGDGWVAAEFPLRVVFLAALPAIVMAYLIAPTPAQSTRQFELRICWEHVLHLRELWGQRSLRLCSLGIAYFWYYGGFMILLFVQLALERSGGMAGNATVLAWLMVASSGGIIFGGVCASMISRKGIELGLVPLGGMLMVLGCMGAGALMWVGDNWSLLHFCLFVAGAGAAFYLVPLNALLQDQVDPEARGRLLAAVNLQNCFGGLVAVGLQGLALLILPPAGQFVFIAVTALVATVAGLRVAPQAFVRFILSRLLRLIYRIQGVNAERLPKTGGVLIVANHVSYADGFFLSLASPRPVRFVIAEEYVKSVWVRWFLEIFDVLPISSTKAKDAIRTAARALQNGDVICIFPEGQLTRFGAIEPLQGGYRLIASRANCPVLPVFLDGVWGSVFSFEGGRFFRKRPQGLRYGITAVFGDVFTGAELDATRLRKEFQRCSRVALEKTGEVADAVVYLKGMLHSRGGQVLAVTAVQSYTGSQIWGRFFGCDGGKKIGANDEQLEVWLSAFSSLLADAGKARLYMTNALQLMRVDGLRRGEPVAYQMGGGAIHPVLGVLFPLIAGSRVEFIEESQAEQWVFDESEDVTARSRLAAKAAEGKVVFQVCKSSMPEEEDIRPILVDQASSLVISMGLREREILIKGRYRQLGHQPGSFGRVLPGIEWADDGSGGQVVTFPHNLEGALPAGYSIDHAGWVRPCEL